MTKPGGAMVNLAYDPLGRLWQVSSSSGTTQFLYDGDELAAEYDGSGNLTRRYHFGPGTDEPDFVDLGGMNCSATYFLHADHEGSIVAATDCGANVTSIDSYDEYGIPGANNWGRFQYTGQAWIPEIGMYYYKARIYSPTLGRFMQTDPVGYDGGINVYEYALDDPVDHDDPSGDQAIALAPEAAALCTGPQAAVCAIAAGVVAVGVGAYECYEHCGAIFHNEKGSAGEKKAKPKVNPDKQGKHQPGHRNFKPGNSEVKHPDPQGLVDKGAGTGQQVGEKPVGEAGSKERVDFGETIGTHVDGETGERSETSVGTIHYGTNDAHVVPARPNPETCNGNPNGC
jgi:RHS repeat-associated protein